MLVIVPVEEFTREVATVFDRLEAFRKAGTVLIERCITNATVKAKRGEGPSG